MSQNTWCLWRPCCRQRKNDPPQPEESTLKTSFYVRAEQQLPGGMAHTHISLRIGLGRKKKAFNIHMRDLALVSLPENGLSRISWWKAAARTINATVGHLFLLKWRLDCVWSETPREKRCSWERLMCDRQFHLWSNCFYLDFLSNSCCFLLVEGPCWPLLEPIWPPSKSPEWEPSTESWSPKM